jgi:hypothetical protein
MTVEKYGVLIGRGKASYVIRVALLELVWKTADNNEKPELEYPMSLPGFEPCTPEYKLGAMSLYRPFWLLIRGAVLLGLRECIQKFSNWPPGARVANCRAICH